MKVKADPRDVVRQLILVEHRPVEDSIRIVMEKHAGKDAAVAVAFEDHDGIQRRGVLGLCGHHGDIWRPSGAFVWTWRGEFGHLCEAQLDPLPRAIIGVVAGSASAWLRLRPRSPRAADRWGCTVAGPGRVPA